MLYLFKCQSPQEQVAFKIAAAKKSAEDLYSAASRGDMVKVSCLIEQGVAIDCVDNYGSTPLIGAAVSGRDNVVTLLLDKGASINHKNNSGYSALMRAKRSGHASTISLLIQRGANQSD